MSFEINKQYIIQLQSLLSLPTSKYINRYNRNLISKYLDVLLEYSEIIKNNPKLNNNLNSDEKPNLKVPESITIAMYEAGQSQCVSSTTTLYGYSLLNEIYNKKKFNPCVVRYGGEDQEDDEIGLHWGSITCYIEKTKATLSYASKDEIWKEIEYKDLSNNDTLIECSARIRRLLSEL